MAKEKTNLYLLSIVGIVAIVGIVVLVLNSGAGSVSLSTEDLSGEAFKVSATKTLSDIDTSFNLPSTVGSSDSAKSCKDQCVLACPSGLKSCTSVNGKCKWTCS